VTPVVICTGTVRERMLPTAMVPSWQERQSFAGTGGLPRHRGKGRTGIDAVRTHRHIAVPQRLHRGGIVRRVAEDAHLLLIDRFDGAWPGGGQIVLAVDDAGDGLPKSTQWH